MHKLYFSEALIYKIYTVKELLKMHLRFCLSGQLFTETVVAMYS